MNLDHVQRLEPHAHGEYVMSGNRAATSEVGPLVRVRTDEGVEGWGEVTPLGDLYLPTHWREVRAALRQRAHVEDALAVLVGGDVDTEQQPVDGRRLRGRRAAERRQIVVLRSASEEIRFLLVLTKLDDLFQLESVVG